MGRLHTFAERRDPLGALEMVGAATLDAAYVGSTVVWVPSDPGFVRADHSLFTLTVSGTDAKYEVHLTEAEMIDVATAWLRLLKPHIEAAKAT